MQVLHVHQTGWKEHDALQGNNLRFSHPKEKNHPLWTNISHALQDVFVFWFWVVQGQVLKYP